MFKNISLKSKLLTLAGLCILPFGVVLACVFIITRETGSAAARECAALSSADLGHTLQGMYAMAVAQQESQEQMIRTTLQVADKLVADGGGMRPAEMEQASWLATNQFSGATHTITLPRMLLGDKWLGQNADPNVLTPIVDEVGRLTGETCTLFQRINEDGDMLRVATNIRKTDGRRAIGTFIPRTNVDGQPNPVIATVLQGKTYWGRAFAVNAWYITAYEPVIDRSGRVIGIVYVGIPQESVASLRKAIASVRIAKTGHAFVLDSKGTAIISPDGWLETSGSGRRDQAGEVVAQSVCRAAVLLGPGEVGEYRYERDDPSGKGSTRQVCRFMYTAAWDWIIGVTVPEDELSEAERRVAAAGGQGRLLLLAVSSTAIFFAVGAALLLASRIARPVRNVVGCLQSVAAGDLTQRVAVTSRDEVGQLASALNEALDRMASAVRDIDGNAQTLAGASDEMAKVSQQMSANAEETAAQAGVVSAAAEQVSKNVQTVATGVEEMGASIREIAKNATEAARVAPTGGEGGRDDQRHRGQARREQRRDRQGHQGHHVDRRSRPTCWR